MTESKAAVVTKFGAPVEIWSVPLPEMEPSSVMIRVDAATLCGTDAHRWLGHLSDAGGNPDQPFIQKLSLPYLPGHETCGTIVDMRGAVTDILDEPLKEGDRIISSYAHCGHCYYCRVTRQTTLCHENTSFGYLHPAQLTGGCSEYHYFPPRGTFVRVPDEVSPPLAASAACALRTVMHGFEQLGPIASHEQVLVLGCGPLGLYSLAVARDRGARATLMIGAPRARLDVAKEWGADHLLDLDDEPDADRRVQWVRDNTSGRGADIVFNCANSHSLPEAMRMVRPGGRVVQIGVTGGPPVQVPPMLFFRGVQLFSPVMAEARHFYQAIDFIATRRKQFSFDRLISNTYRLDQTTEALQAMAAFREVKPLIVPKLAA